MNNLPYPIVVNLIVEWPALAFVNRYTYRIYKKHIKNQGYVTMEYYLNPCNKTLKNMCKKGKYIEIFCNMDWDYGLYGACKGGYLNIMNLMIEKGTDNWDWGLGGACRGGHLNIVNLMIEKGADDWNFGHSSACRGGHLNIVNLMIEKGVNKWNWGLSRACKGGNLNIVNLMIKMGATNCYNCDISKHIF